MPIDLKTVQKIAHLAKLTLTPAEEQIYAAQLEKIVAYVEQLQEVDTSQVEPLAQVLETTNVMRTDQVRPSLAVTEVLRNAPNHRQGYFVVPKVIKGNTE